MGEQKQTDLTKAETAFMVATTWWLQHGGCNIVAATWWLQHAYWNTSGDFLNRISHRDARSNILTTLSPPQVHSLLPSIEREKVSEYQPEGVILIPKPLPSYGKSGNETMCMS